MRHALVAELMQPEVAFLEPEETLDLADDLMSLGEIRHLPVVTGKALVGMLSQRDLAQAAISSQLAVKPKRRREFLRGIRVRDVMSASVETIEPTASVEEAARRMHELRIGALPVVFEGRLLGLVTLTDLVKHAYLAKPGEGPLLPATVAGRLVELKRLGEEFRVQASLGRAEAQQLWDDLEERLETLGADLRHACVPGDGVIGGVISSVQGLLEDLRRPKNRQHTTALAENAEPLDSGEDRPSL